MGQFLSIGIIKDLHIQKENLEEYTFDDLKPTIEKRGYHLDIFHPNIEGNQWKGTLKTEILEAELLPFLERIYSLLKDFTNLSDYLEVLEETKTITDVQKFLEDASFYDFQLDNYGHGSRIYVERSKNQRMDINFDALSLKMAGKILMESDEGLFSLFTSLLQQQLADFQLSKALKVYITG